MKNIINLIIMQFSNLYSIKKNLIIMAIIAIFLAFTNGNMLTYVGTLYIMMTCYTVVAYEEKSKMDYLIRTLPIKQKDFILSKFIFIGLNTIIGALATYILGLITVRDPQIIKLSLITIVAMGIITMTIIIPFALTLGFQKGRVFLIIIMMIPLALSTEIMSEIPYENIANANLGLIGIIISVIMILVSYFITSSIYSRKEV